MTYDWLRKIPGTLFDEDEKPLLGTIPEFPLEKFNQALVKSLQNDSIKVKASEPQWRTEADLFKGIGTPYKILAMVVSTLEGRLYWAMAEEELSGLMATLLMPGNAEPDYLDGFYHFFGLEAINAFKNSGFDPRLSVQLLREPETPQGAMLTVDATLSIGDKPFNGRLFIDSDLRKSIKTFYSREKEKDIYQSPFAEKLNVFVGVEVGKTTLTATEWSQVKKGDLVLLDSCTIKPGETKGRVTITYQDRPFFLAKWQEGSIKLSERPLYTEVNIMATNDAEDEDFEEEEDLEEEEEEFEDDEEEEETEADGEEDKAAPAASEAPAATPAKKTAVAAVPEEKKKTAKSPDEIPLNVVVEIARLQMPLKTLMNLQPGNLLDLDIHPENGVDLVVNGNRIARGELLQIGEKLGVRILDK